MSSVRAWCNTCEAYQMAEVAERSVTPPPNFLSRREGAVVRATCPTCGTDLFGLDPDESVTWLFEVRPGKHASADETSTFVVTGSRGELEEMERELGAENWVSAGEESVLTPAEVRTEYESLFEASDENEALEEASAY
jgi:hypothetical protein